MKNFALSSTSSTYTPPSLEGRGISFILREPNEDEMEKLSTELFRRGCVPVEQGRMRAVLIDELYHLFDEAAADEKAGLLEQVWNADTAYNNAVGLWMDQERQRLLDIANGAPEYPAAKHPVPDVRSEEHTSELQSLMRNSYAVFCLKKKNEKYMHQETHKIINK